MKKVLGLDLGTTSIGWALVNQAEDASEKSSIIRAGVRVNPLSVDEKDSFEKGKAITTNADRTLKRGMRRNLQRYKLRRTHLRETLIAMGWIPSSGFRYSEEGPNSTYSTYRLRAKAATEEISLAELSRVLLMINKKRGYKSSRKTDSTEEGNLIDGMSVAKALYERGLTPAQYSLELIAAGKKVLPDYYRSDLLAEFESIWQKQQFFYPDILTKEFKEKVLRSGKNGAAKLFLAVHNIYTADNKGKEKRTVALQWRVDALSQQLDKEHLAYVVTDLAGAIQNSSGYLGAISDRSKELFFNKQTVGQYLYARLTEDHHYSTRNVVFYRQDYIDEFNTIWECQKQFHPELTDEAKHRLEQEIIFYQRRLKSQKNLISLCEFEQREVRTIQDGKVVVRTHGCRVAPRSSLLFQEFKIWQVLNNVIIKQRAGEGLCWNLSEDEKAHLAQELSIRPKMSAAEALKLLRFNSRQYELNYKQLEGNVSMTVFFEKYLEIVSATGHGEYDLKKMSFEEASSVIKDVFSALGFNTDILSFRTDLPKEQYEQQPLFKLWHLLYSYEGDNSNTGDYSLIEKISTLCSMPREYAAILSKITFKEDYASLSHKAMSKILPYLKAGNTYDLACGYAGYNHSHSMTAEERDSRPLKDRLEVLPKGALRNPVVEKIINQMINVVNAVADEYGKPDEIHIELARELKQSAKEREEDSRKIAENTRKNEDLVNMLKKEFGLVSVSKNDLLRFKLYEELKENGYKTLYSNQYIPRDILFSKSIDIEHIIPQALLFDDSFSNKTLEFRDINIEKSRETANDYVRAKYGQEYYDQYKLRVEDLYEKGVISKAKRNKLLMPAKDIPEGFIERDLRNSQYIARKSRELLEDYVHIVMPTSGAITARLREDWQLVDVMKELNLPKYAAVGRVSEEIREDGHVVKRIDDWTKRDDHRHHAMDALTIAFTKPSHIQYLNNLRTRVTCPEEFEELMKTETVSEDRKRILTPPMPLNDLRASFKKELESVLVSIKAKNKVVTRNVNRIKTADGVKKQLTLTPRGLLHKEQVYGKRFLYETYFSPVGAKMTADEIERVASQAERDALRSRLMAFDGNSKKAFTGSHSVDRDPIYTNDSLTATVPSKVKCVRLKTVYSIRKDIDPNLSVDKVLDQRIRQLLTARLAEYGGDPKKAFSNLTENPIWLNEEKRIPVKRVTIVENFDLDALHDKRDKDGRSILDIQGYAIPSDFVNLRNNHHIAIYKDENGDFQEVVVPFFEALNRITQGYPAVDKHFRKQDGWEFQFSIKSNEMFVFPNPNTGFNPTEIDLLDPKNYAEISPNLFRVQKIGSKDYTFRHHLESTINQNQKELMDITWKRIRSLPGLNGAVKVRINHIGQIVAVGEYD